MVFLLDVSCLEKEAEYVGTGDSVGILLCFGISSLAVVLNRFQPSQISGDSSLDPPVFGYDLLEDGKSHKAHGQPELGHRTFSACLRDH